MQVGPSFFDAPGADVAELPGRSLANYHDVNVTVVFCSGCHMKVWQETPFQPPALQSSCL